MELSYFPEVLVCEADYSVGGERFVFRAANSPKGSRGPCASLCSAVQAGQWGSRGTAALQGLWRVTACKSKLPEQTACNASCKWRDGWTDGQAQHCPVRVPEVLRKYCVPRVGLCTPSRLLRGGAAASPSQRWGN